MHNIVVVEIVPDVRPFKFTVIVVSVHFFGHWLVEVAVEETQKIPAVVRSHVEHKEQPAHVDEREHDNTTLDALHGLTISEICVGFQIGVGNHEEHNTVDCSPTVSFEDLIILLSIGWHVF